jgi:inner membrane protein
METLTREASDPSFGDVGLYGKRWSGVNFLGPIGLTVAFVWLLSWVLRRFLTRSYENNEPVAVRRFRLVDRFANEIDYRLILVGALIPDLIDKPLIFAVNPHFVNSSLRSVGHSVVGAVAMFAIVWVITKGWQRASTLSFGFALAAHLVVDRMWEMPEVLLWPTLGYVLPEQNIPFSHWWRNHFERPPTTLIDLVGIALLVLVVGRVTVSRSTIRFLKTGQWS